jgi:hypothetical protein
MGAGLLLPGVSLARAEEQTAVRLRVEQQALLKIPQRDRNGLDIRKDTSAEAKALAEGAPPSLAVPVFLIVAGVLTLPALYDAIHEMVRETVYGGVIIDLRTSPPTVTNDKRVPGGLVQRINPDGQVETVPSHSFLIETLQAWIGGGKGKA